MLGKKTPPEPAHHELAELLAEWKCAKTIRRYAELADGDDAKSFVDLFTPDAYWQRPDKSVLMGREAIRSFYAGRPRVRVQHHLVMNISVQTQSPMEASASSVSVVLRRVNAPVGSEEVGTTMTFARYDDILTCAPDGQWRFGRRESTVLVAGELKK